MLKINVVLLLLLIGLFKNEIYGMSLWDQVVKKEHVFLTVEYEQRYLNVWRQDSHGYSKFYVTPLCVMDIDSITCSRDEYSNVHRHSFEFNLKLWDSKAAKVVQNALKQNNVTASLSHILPLPMQQVRIGLGGKDLAVEADSHWRSNQDQPHAMAFELYTRHEHFCNKMISDAKNNTKRFIRAIKPYFEFTMIVGQHETRNFNLTGRILQKSALFSELVNNHADNNGIVYLQSKDLNRLTRDLYNRVALEEEVTAGYISSTQEHQIIKELLDIFKEQQISSKDLTEVEWNSVFWDDIFARPDVVTEYANEVLKYDEKERKFTYDSEKDQKFRQNIENRHNSNKNRLIAGKTGFSLFGIAKFGGSAGSVKHNYENSESKYDTEKNERNTLSLDDFNKTIHKENINLKWTGTKFEPKDLTLYRLNTRNFNSSNEIYFKRVVVTKHQTTQKIEIKASDPSPCPESWIYYNATDFCYKAIQPNSTWQEAEAQCVKENAHLASIHSFRENMFVTSLPLLTHNIASPPCDWQFQARIGLSKEDGFNFKWTDGTPLDYASWTSGAPYADGVKCVSLWIGQSCYDTPLTWSVSATQWFNNNPCENKVINAICKKAPNN